MVPAGSGLTTAMAATAKPSPWASTPTWNVSHGERIIRRFERDIFPWIGSKPVAEIAAPELLTVELADNNGLPRINECGFRETE